MIEFQMIIEFQVIIEFQLIIEFQKIIKFQCLQQIQQHCDLIALVAILQFLRKLFGFPPICNDLDCERTVVVWLYLSFLCLEQLFACHECRIWAYSGGFVANLAWNLNPSIMKKPVIMEKSQYKKLDFFVYFQVFKKKSAVWLTTMVLNYHLQSIQQNVAKKWAKW